VSFNYVLILEWLDESDVRTGHQLHDYLQSIQMPSKLVVCNCANDIADALADALHSIRTLGTPVVHIESHGSDPADVSFQKRDFGFSGAPEIHAAPGLSWRDLGDWLAPLNEACDFAMLVVGATCFGFASIAAMKLHENVAPFAGCVGFTTSVYPGSLRDSMKELYLSFKSGSDLKSSVENANRELRGSNESLRATSATMLAYQISREVYDQFRTPDAMDGWLQSMTTKVRDAGLAVTPLAEWATPTNLHQLARENIQRAWDGWFPHALQERDCGYRLDWTIVELVEPE
jgi:hypothetical protein